MCHFRVRDAQHRADSKDKTEPEEDTLFWVMDQKDCPWDVPTSCAVWQAGCGVGRGGGAADRSPASSQRSRQSPFCASCHATALSRKHKRDRRRSASARQFRRAAGWLWCWLWWRRDGGERVVIKLYLAPAATFE